MKLRVALLAIVAVAASLRAQTATIPSGFATTSRAIASAGVISAEEEVALLNSTEREGWRWLLRGIYGWRQWRFVAGMNQDFGPGASSLGFEGRNTTQHIPPDQDEEGEDSGHDYATHNGPLDGLETALAQHEFLDLVQHFHPPSHLYSNTAAAVASQLRLDFGHRPRHAFRPLRCTG